MNPFTRFLSQWSGNQGLAEFISYWDRLEALTIAIYKEKVDVVEAAVEFEAVWPWLRGHYGRWQPQLRPLWQQTKVAGEPTKTDPFQLLLDLPNPTAIQNNWKAMQHLPAAREALNYLLLQSGM